MSPQTVNERAHGRRRTRRALVLGGGGLLGAMFQIEVLAALEEADPDRTEFDLDGLMDFRVASRLLADGERAAQRFLLQFTPACDVSR